MKTPTGFEACRSFSLKENFLQKSSNFSAIVNKNVNYYY